MLEELSPETVQTVQEKPPSRTPFWEIAKDAQGQWHWVLWSGNGRRIATNDIPIVRKKDAVNAIRAVKATIAEAAIVVTGSE
jgi:uncharacterized protein YegP (UPF0339 family)